MKNTRMQFSLILTVVLIFTLLSTPAPAAAGKPDVAAAPVQYTLFVDGKSTSPWAYEIEGDVYFKLRDLAMALNGTEKQFNVNWDASKNAVLLTTGTAYTPVGGEMSEASHAAGNIAHLPATTFYIDNKIVPLRAYALNNTHYIMLPDLAASLLLSAACDEEKHTVKLNTQIYDSGIYSFSLPEGWSASGSTYSLSFSRSGKSVGSFIIRNYDSDKPISQFEDNHRTTLSREDLSGFDYTAAKAVIRAAQPASAHDDSYMDELHIYIMLADLRCAFDFSFDSSRVDEQTAMEIAKSLVPKKEAIKMNATALQWAEAIKNRDGRAQYELLGAKLQAEFKDYYENVNWVTGVSSPWINSYEIEIMGDYAVVFFENMTSAGFAGYTADTLSFSEENGQLKIRRIDGFNNFSVYSAEKGVIPLQFKTEKLNYKKLPVLDESKVTSYVCEAGSEDITQGFYKADGNIGADITDYYTYGNAEIDGEYYSYLIIGGIKYDLGWVGYVGGNKDYMLGTYGINSTDITWDTPVYQLNRTFGLSAMTTSYLTIDKGVPYIIFDIPGRGIQYDIDGDGTIETTANAGGSTSQDFVLYEWDMQDKSIRHVRLMDLLDPGENGYNITAYGTDENLFRAFSRDQESGEWTQSAYEYKAGKLIPVE